MKYGLAIFDSGNYALNLIRILEKKNYFFEFTAIPCSISNVGCGYCIKFPMEYMNMIIDEGIKYKLYVRQIYEVSPGFNRNRYKRVYPMSTVANSRL